VFAAGASHYGVADLELLAKETHKFESRYLDNLLGTLEKVRRVCVETATQVQTCGPGAAGPG
jgi:hypothetical protein